MAKISVITPTYNRADTLPRAIDSVRRQTYQDYEHIVVDDGSTDETPSVIEDHVHENLEYVRCEDNEGVAAAWNRGIGVATGEYITFLDSDDEYLPNRLAVTNDVLDSHPRRVSGVAHSYRLVEFPRARTRRIPAGIFTFGDLAQQNFIKASSVTMYRAAALERVGGFDESLPSTVDYDCQLRVLDTGPMVGIDEVLARKHERGAGIQDNPRKVRVGLERFLSKHGNRITRANRVRRQCRIGRACLQLEEPTQARVWFERALDTSPANARGETQYIIGRIYLRTNRRARARWHLLASIRERPLPGKAHLLMGLALVPVDGSTTFGLAAKVHKAVASLLPER